MYWKHPQIVCKTMILTTLKGLLRVHCIESMHLKKFINMHLYIIGAIMVYHINHPCTKEESTASKILVRESGSYI